MKVKTLKKALENFDDEADIFICDDWHSWKGTMLAKDEDGDLIIRSDGLQDYINNYSME